MRTALAFLVAVALAGCGIPRDPEGTLERVTGGTLVAGAVAVEPWVVAEDGRPAGGVEVRLAEEFARTLDADVEWMSGSEHELLAALEAGELDLVVGGLDASSPWGTRVSFTRPYLRTFLGVGVSDPDQVGEGIEGLRVAVERNTHAAALVREAGAEPFEVAEVSTGVAPAAVESWRFDDLRLLDSGVRLLEVAHVMAVRPGENAWVTALERFLSDRRDEIGDLLEAEGAA